MSDQPVHWMDQKYPQPVRLWEKIGMVVVVVALAVFTYVRFFQPEIWFQVWR